MKTSIYIMTHKAFTPPDESFYIPLHVGKSISDDLGYLGDDTGKNISSKNKSYCELTGIYWLWKNIQCDIIGICHYRRYFIHNDDFIHQDYIENKLDQYDVILPTSGLTKYTNLDEHYAKIHHIRDLKVCREVISEKYPQYIPAFDWCMSCNLFSLGNMMITHKSIFDEYCEWLFDILFAVEERIDITDYDNFQKRVFGYLSERLLRVWFLHNKYRVFEENIRLIDPADSHNEQKGVSLKYQYLRLLLQDIIEQHQNYTVSEALPASPIDFHNKIPVWVCWWQGIEQAPEIIKLCLNSMIKHLPEEQTELHLITLANVQKYVAFPEHIIQKFNQGSISMTHLSDMLRFELLYRYGGIWLDASYFLTAPLPERWFTHAEDTYFTTHRLFQPPWKADIVKGRWSSNLMGGNAGNQLFSFVLDALYAYHKREEQMLDYFLIDYVVALAYDSLPTIRQMIDSNPFDEPELLHMLSKLNSKYTKEAFDCITRDTHIFKLSYKIDVNETNILGEPTYYGYLKSGN